MQTGTGLRVRRKPYKRHGFFHPFCNFIHAQTHVGWTKRDIFCNGFFKKLILGILEHQSNAKARASVALAFFIPNGLSAEQDFARSRLQQSVKMLNQGGFSRACVPDDSQNLAFLHLKVDLFERRALKRGACPVNMGQSPAFLKCKTRFFLLCQSFITAVIPALCQIFFERIRAFLHAHCINRKVCTGFAVQVIQHLNGLRHGKRSAATRPPA